MKTIAAYSLETRWAPDEIIWKILVIGLSRKCATHMRMKRIDEKNKSSLSGSDRCAIKSSFGPGAIICCHRASQRNDALDKLNSIKRPGAAGFCHFSSATAATNRFYCETKRESCAKTTLNTKESFICGIQCQIPFDADFCPLLSGPKEPFLSALESAFE